VSGRELTYYDLPAEERERVLGEIRRRLEEEGDVVFAYAHGGFVERRFFRDVDVAVWLRDPSRAFYYAVELSARLEAEVKLPVDLQVLNEAPLPFRFHVFTRGRLLFSRDEGLRSRLVDETVREYLDFKCFLSLHEQGPARPRQPERASTPSPDPSAA